MNGPFDTDVMDETDALEESVDEGHDAAFDEGDDQGDGFTDEMSAADQADADTSDTFEGDSASDLGDEFGEGADDMAVWNAFEEEVADGLDAGDTDEFLARLLGGLGRAGGVVGRGLASAAGTAGQVGSMAQGVGSAARQVSRVAGAMTPATQAAARLARMLGAPGVAGALGQAGRVAQGVRGAANRVGGVANSVGQAAGGAQGLFRQLSQLIGQGFDELDDFDAMADLYTEDGVDEALPALVALAARSAARGMGLRNVAQLTQAGRRALVRGVGSAARELVRGNGPSAVRALPRLTHAAARAAQRGAATPARAAQVFQRQLPATARRVAQSPRLMQRLEQPARARAARARHEQPTRPGFGMPAARPGRVRTYNFPGPITLTMVTLR